MTFAALKRHLQVGTQLELIAGPTQFHQSRLPWHRVISRVQSNAIAFEPDQWTRGRESWLYWPAARYVQADEHGFIVGYPDSEDRLVYRFV